METIQPVVLHGCSAWDQEVLPLDEFTVRVQQIQKTIKDHELKGLIIFSDVRNYAKVCYFSNYVPKHSYAILLIPATGDIRLLAKLAGTRDIPYVQTLTWIEDIRAIKNLSGEINDFMNYISTSDNTSRLKVGICGTDIMPFSVYHEIREATKDAGIMEMDFVLNEMLRKKRPREKVVMEQAALILQKSVEAVKRIYRREGSVVTAIVEAERAARNNGAQDVRALYSLDSGKTLQPLDVLSEIRNDPMIVYLAIEYLGYWVEGFVTLSKKSSVISNQTATLLNYFKESMKSGMTIGNLIKGANQFVTPYKLHPITGGQFGYNIGLSLQQKPLLDMSFGEEVLEEGSIYSVHACLTNNKDEHCLLSAILVIEKDHNEILWSSLQE